MTLLEEFEADTTGFPVALQIMAKPKGKEALALRQRAKALKDILTCQQMMCDLSERQTLFLRACCRGMRLTSAEEDELIANCQEVLNVGCY